VSQWVSHRDGRFFAELDLFLPGRWLDGSTDELPRYAYFPFGGGPRLCVGRAFAEMEAVLVLAAVARRFRLRPVPGSRVDLQPTITLRPRGSGMWMAAERR
jgi:cytochrome P450